MICFLNDRLIKCQLFLDKNLEFVKSYYKKSIIIIIIIIERAALFSTTAGERLLIVTDLPHLKPKSLLHSHQFKSHVMCF